MKYQTKTKQTCGSEVTDRIGGDLSSDPPVTSKIHNIQLCKSGYRKFLRKILSSKSNSSAGNPKAHFSAFIISQEHFPLQSNDTRYPAIFEVMGLQFSCSLILLTLRDSKKSVDFTKTFTRPIAVDYRNGCRANK